MKELMVSILARLKVIVADVKRAYSLIKNMEQTRYCIPPSATTNDKPKKTQVSENFVEQNQESLSVDALVHPRSPNLKVAPKLVEDHKKLVSKEALSDSKPPMPALKLIVHQKPLS